MKKIKNQACFLRAYTLIEVMIAMTAGAILLAVGLSGFQQIINSSTGAERASGASEEAKLLNEYLSSSVQGIGGGTVRPWAAVDVQDNAGIDNTDIVVIYEIDDSFNECLIQTRPGRGNVFTFAMTSTDAGSVCDCLSGLSRGMRVMVTTADGSSWGALQVETVTPNPSCQATFTPTASGLSRLPGSPGNFVGGAMSIGHVKLFSVNANQQLQVQIDSNSPQILADNVYDFQVALGYDQAPGDGIITDNGDNTDEWAFNSGVANADNIPTDGGTPAPGLVGVSDSDLRMLRIGLIIGSPTGASLLQSSAQVLNGPVRSRAGWVMRPVDSSLSLRNLNIMQ